MCILNSSVNMLKLPIFGFLLANVDWINRTYDCISEALLDQVPFEMELEDFKFTSIENMAEANNRLSLLLFVNGCFAVPWVMWHTKIGACLCNRVENYLLFAKAPTLLWIP